ncbi:pepsin/retropepsin-like aspartic protease family protein [Thalassotalea mangrovi]|uniref:Signal protein PDZ n=1 Tax=Thalassotalea mangrovi TaxID=2572245 RepID=A0A4U1B7A5_9GAMM|nr:pepsin/retropepsin-like aspartic protease family protein [Thalassotalea mangrovi]TKB46391.1 signal protein PDZ [Thalassotalea mangrovi]
MLKKAVALFLVGSTYFPSLPANAEWVPFTLKNNHIFIDLTLAGQSTEAMLDSGANIHMINQAFVDEHGEDFTRTGHIEVQGVNSKQKFPLYNQIPIEVFGAQFELNKVVGGELNNIDFLFGNSFFKNIIVQIDYPNSKMQLLPQQAVDLAKHANLPMRRALGSGLPAVQVEINGEKVWLTLDTGNNSGIYIKRGWAEENGLLDETKLISSTVEGINSSMDTENFSVNSLKFGPYELENVKMTVPVDGAVTYLGKNNESAPTGSRLKRGIKTKGILGYDILKHFLLTIDYENYRAHIIAQ